MKTDVEIYYQFNGKMVRVGETNRPDRANFLILWKGKDWSGFRTLAECEAQIAELEGRYGNNYTIVERF